MTYENVQIPAYFCVYHRKWVPVRNISDINSEDWQMITDPNHVLQPEIDWVRTKMIHPLYQTPPDLRWSHLKDRPEDLAWSQWYRLHKDDLFDSPVTIAKYISDRIDGFAFEFCRLKME